MKFHHGCPCRKNPFSHPGKICHCYIPGKNPSDAHQLSPTETLHMIILTECELYSVWFRLVKGFLSVDNDCSTLFKDFNICYTLFETVEEPALYIVSCGWLSITESSTCAWQSLPIRTTHKFLSSTVRLPLIPYRLSQTHCSQTQESNQLNTCWHQISNSNCLQSSRMMVPNNVIPLLTWSVFTFHQNNYEKPRFEWKYLRYVFRIENVIKRWIDR